MPASASTISGLPVVTSPGDGDKSITLTRERLASAFTAACRGGGAKVGRGAPSLQSLSAGAALLTRLPDRKPALPMQWDDYGSLLSTYKPALCERDRHCDDAALLKHAQHGLETALVRHLPMLLQAQRGEVSVEAALDGWADAAAADTQAEIDAHPADHIGLHVTEMLRSIAQADRTKGPDRTAALRAAFHHVDTVYSGLGVDIIDDGLVRRLRALRRHLKAAADCNRNGLLADNQSIADMLHDGRTVDLLPLSWIAGSMGNAPTTAESDRLRADPAQVAAVESVLTHSFQQLGIDKLTDFERSDDYWDGRHNPMAGVMQIDNTVYGTYGNDEIADAATNIESAIGWLQQYLEEL